MTLVYHDQNMTIDDILNNEEKHHEYNMKRVFRDEEEETQFNTKKSNFSPHKQQLYTTSINYDNYIYNHSYFNDTDLDNQASSSSNFDILQELQAIKNNQEQQASTSSMKKSHLLNMIDFHDSLEDDFNINKNSIYSQKKEPANSLSMLLYNEDIQPDQNKINESLHLSNYYKAIEKEEMTTDFLEQPSLFDEIDQLFENPQPSISPTPTPKTTSSAQITSNSRYSPLYTSIIELLTLMNIPYIFACSEAESECIYLEKASVVDGIISDDSDTFVFGGQTVYKDIFTNSVYVTEYRLKDIYHELSMNQEQLISLALLLGGDYSDVFLFFYDASTS